MSLYQFILERENTKIDFSANILNNIIDLGYGISSEIYNVSAIEPGMKNENYRLHKSILPKEGDLIIHKKSGRKFKVGKISGFLHYEADLLENNIPVAKLKFEDYYKD